MKTEKVSNTKGPKEFIQFTRDGLVNVIDKPLIIRITMSSMLEVSLLLPSTTALIQRRLKEILTSISEV